MRSCIISLKALIHVNSQTFSIFLFVIVIVVVVNRGAISSPAFFSQILQRNNLLLYFVVRLLYLASIYMYVVYGLYMQRSLSTKAIRNRTLKTKLQSKMKKMVAKWKLLLLSFWKEILNMNGWSSHKSFIEMVNTNDMRTMAIYKYPLLFYQHLCTVQCTFSMRRQHCGRIAVIAI